MWFQKSHIIEESKKFFLAISKLNPVRKELYTIYNNTYNIYNLYNVELKIHKLDI